MKYKILVIIFFCSIFCFSQTKNESELRINETDFPEQTTLAVKEIKEHAKKIRFYKETDNSKVSFEAKFKCNKQKYSVEFSENGILEDIEVTIKKKAISKNALEAITDYLNTNFAKFRFKKIQKQYVFDNNIYEHIFISLAILGNVNINNYEIIAEVKENNTRQLKEFLFDNTGKHIYTKAVTISSYEHVLY